MTPARHLHKKGEGETGVKEADGVKEGVWGTSRDRERVGRGGGTKEENMNRQITPTIIKRQKTNNYVKMQRT